MVPPPINPGLTLDLQYWLKPIERYQVPHTAYDRHSVCGKISTCPAYVWKAFLQPRRPWSPSWRFGRASIPQIGGAWKQPHHHRRWNLQGPRTQLVPAHQVRSQRRWAQPVLCCVLRGTRTLKGKNCFKLQQSPGILRNIFRNFEPSKLKNKLAQFRSKLSHCLFSCIAPVTSLHSTIKPCQTFEPNSSKVRTNSKKHVKRSSNQRSRP